MLLLTLLGDPKSTQHCYKMTCRGRFASMYMSKEAKEIKESYQWQAKNQIGVRTEYPLSTPLEININLFFGTKRKYDIDNFGKLLLDSLTGIVWQDDSQIGKMTIIKHYDKERPRIVIQVAELTL